ncbi:MAG TPA: hypothetical protein PLL33_09940 [Paracoccus sp. (in: a-proteobacteria)]|nr:hypothetical protein [Paracoccus sp. (in: a-proteobacteria)]
MSRSNPTRHDGTAPSAHAPVHLDLRGVASVCALARQLIRDGADPKALLYAWRGATLCFTPMPLRRWAGLATEERATRSIRFVRHRAPDGPQGDEYAPQAGNRALPQANERTSP